MGLECDAHIEVLDDGIVRHEVSHWVYYYDPERVDDLDLMRCGKWLYMTADLERADELVHEAVATGAVIEAKRSNEAQVMLARTGSGVCCFYLNGDDVEAHRRAIKFLLSHGLVRRTKAGRLYNVSFKFDAQTYAGESGKDFHAKIRLADFVDLDTGEFLEQESEVD